MLKVEDLYKYTEFEELQAVRCNSRRSVRWQWEMPEKKAGMNIEVRSQKSL